MPAYVIPSTHADVAVIVDGDGNLLTPGRQGSTQKTVTATSAADTAQTVTIAAVAAKRNTISKIVLFASVAGTATLKLQEAAVDKVNFGTVTTAVEGKVFDVLYTGAVNTALQVVVGTAGVGNTTTVSVVADAP